MSCNIRQVTTDEARQFWLQQADARIFLHPDVLEPMCERVDWWLARWNGNAVCLWPMCTAFDGTHRPPELSAYVGPLWADTVIQSKAHRWWGITSGVQREMLELFVGRYHEFVFELPPGTSDIRIFQWLQSDGADRLSVEIDCRHTAILQLQVGGTDESLLSRFSRNRVKDIRRMKRESALQSWNDAPADALCALYTNLLSRKASDEFANRRQRVVLALTKLVKDGFGQIAAYRDETGAQASFILSLDSRKSTSLVLAASTDEANASGVQAFVKHDLLTKCIEQGKTRVDFLGANSKIGAEEKHRYGAYPAIYFRIKVQEVSRPLNGDFGIDAAIEPSSA